MRGQLRAIAVHGACLALLAAAAVGACWQLAGGRAIPLDTTPALAMAPWAGAQVSHTDATFHPFADAHTLRFWPWYRYMHAVGRGEASLFWNPLEGAGMPFLAVWQTRALSPFSIPFYLLPPITAFFWSTLLKLLVAGWCAYYVARRYAFSTPFALLIALQFQLGGAVYLLWDLPVSDVTPWLPLVLMLAERLALGHARAWASGTVTLALMLLGGDPAAFSGALLAAGLFLGARLITSRSPRRTVLGSGGLLLVAVLLAFGLAGVQVLPHIELQRLATVEPSYAPGGAPSIGDLSALVLPHGAAVQAGMMARGAQMVDTSTLGLLHIGWLPLFLVPMWFAIRRVLTRLQTQSFDAMLLAAGTLLLLTLSSPLWLAWLPVPHGFAPMHLLLACGLFLTLPAAAAAEEWLDLGPESTLDTLRRLPKWLGLAAAAAAAAIAWRATRTGEAPFPLADAGVFTVVCASFAALIVASLMRPSRWVMGGAFCLVAVFNAWWSVPAFQAKSPADAVFPESAVVQALQAEGDRVAGDAVRNWPLAGNGIPQLYTPSGIALERHAVFAEALGRDPFLYRRAGAPALVLTRDDISGPFAKARPALQLKTVFRPGAALFDDLEAQPRAWVAYEVASIVTATTGAISSSEPPAVETGIALPGTTPPETARAELTDTPGRVAVQVEHDAPGILVLADAWYPGWHVTVDGQPVESFAVDALFRGIDMPAGIHRAEWRYRPASLRWGMALSAGSCLILALGFIRVWAHSRRPRTP